MLRLSYINIYNRLRTITVTIYNLIQLYIAKKDSRAGLTENKLLPLLSDLWGKTVFESVITVNMDQAVNKLFKTLILIQSHSLVNFIEGFVYSFS